ncbi:hypothetical protein AFEL58S_00008 [Afipia felis]
MRIDRPDREWAAFIAGAGTMAGTRRIAVAALIVAGVATGALYFRGDSPRGEAGPDLSSRRAAPVTETLSATFSICGAGRRADCVVDGDTFWFRGEKIRIADIDAPELSPPRCVREADLGEAAKRRLLALLNAGPFTLVAADRDQDRYGRKLRTVSRGGRSIGDVLIAEGLARRWNGPRGSWCQ